MQYGAGLLCATVFCCVLLPFIAGDGAGRAFPVDTENYAIKQFKTVNPSLEWDKTNFLVDLSGQFATCNQVKGQLKSDRKTPNGFDVDVFIDIVKGEQSDIDAVDKYIREVIDRWVSGGQYNNLISKSKRFGCSVRPKCSGNAVVACVVTEDDGSSKPQSIVDNGGDRNGGWGDGRGDGNNGGGWGDKNNGGGWGDNGRGDGNQGGWDGSRNKTEKDDSANGNGWDGDQKALAFTPEQYDIAENILGNKWDRSHFLEDLSGFETDCSMIGRNDWAFDKMKKPARDRDMKVTGQYGNAPNKGSTPDALKAILNKFKPIQAKQMGCSIIPDCKTASGMEVVISCLYEDV